MAVDVASVFPKREGCTVVMDHGGKLYLAGLLYLWRQGIQNAAALTDSGKPVSPRSHRTVAHQHYGTSRVSTKSKVAESTTVFTGGEIRIMKSASGSLLHEAAAVFEYEPVTSRIPIQEKIERNSGRKGRQVFIPAMGMRGILDEALSLLLRRQRKIRNESDVFTK